MASAATGVGPVLGRRALLKGTAGGALAGALAGVRLPGAWAAPAAARGGYPFTLGVASGDPLPDRVVIWTRLAPDPLHGGGMPERNVGVHFEVAADEGFRRIVQEGDRLASPGAAHSVRADVAGLEPARWYWYRFRTGDAVSPVGRTRTAPAPGAGVGRLRFAFANCQQYEHGYYTAYRRMSEEDLDLAVHLGDYIYEYAPDVYVAPEGNVRRHVGGETETLEDYRNRHAQYRTDPDLQAAHAAFPWIVTWDDHEVENNYADEVPEESDPDPQRFLQRRANAYRAYFEHMPLRAPAPFGPDLRVYRRFGWGDLAELRVLDTRQYRDDQPCGDRFPANCRARFGGDRTILGAEQERWLFDGLARSQARWNVLAQQIFLAQIDLVAGRPKGVYVDGWDGYVASRNRLLDFLRRAKVANPVVLTGDWHANWLCDLKTRFDDPDSAQVGTEFVGTSISSTDVAGKRPKYGVTVLEENPHIRYFNNQRGYVRCTVERDSWRTDYRVVPYIDRPGAPVATAASFALRAGDPRAHRL